MAAHREATSAAAAAAAASQHKEDVTTVAATATEVRHCVQTRHNRAGCSDRCEGGRETASAHYFATLFFTALRQLDACWLVSGFIIPTDMLCNGITLPSAARTETSFTFISLGLK